MGHFVFASIVWWLGVCAPPLLAMSKFSGGEHLYGIVLCTLALAMVPYGLCYLSWAGLHLPQLTPRDLIVVDSLNDRWDRKFF